MSASPLVLNATLVSRMDFNEELAVFRIKPDGGPVAEFQPGQYTTIGLPDDEPDLKRPRLIRRAYSIASSPNDREAMEFYIVRVQDGALTPRLWELKEGDRLWLDNRAKGLFTLDATRPGKDLVMLSTGTGLAPYIAMLRTWRGQPRWRRFIIINGVRQARDLGYREELEAIHRAGDCVYIPVVSREPDFPGLRGRINVALEDAVYEAQTGGRLLPEECHVFLCGNPDMITGTQAWLESRGFTLHSKRSPGNIHLEKYW